MVRRCKWVTIKIPGGGGGGGGEWKIGEINKFSLIMPEINNVLLTELEINKILM